jgi:hypothetical protein
VGRAGGHHMGAARDCGAAWLARGRWVRSGRTAGGASEGEPRSGGWAALAKATEEEWQIDRRIAHSGETLIFHSPNCEPPHPH